MPINKSDKSELLEKLNELLKKQSLFQQAINELEREITQLKIEEPEPEPTYIEQQKSKIPETKPKEIERIVHRKKAEKSKPIVQLEVKKEPDFWEKSGFGPEVEQFIGGNLINKIGIAVLIVGVGIGAKYAIDNNLISPLVRILLGYLVAGILTLFALRLKKNYINFSAVLISGAMAIYYFITYAAYSYYSLYTNSVTFILMVLFTVLTVALALYYNRQVIAHYGMVGAYLVPFLVGNPDSSVVTLFIYMVIINSGILIISTKKKWKLLNYLAFIATWGIFISWFASKNYNNQLNISLIFASLFFTIFYLVFLSYKLLLKEKLKIDDIVFLLLNSAIFYTVGMIALSIGNYYDDFAGLFSFINAIIHGFTAFLVYKSETKNKHLFYWTLGIVIAFVTVAVGLQFNEYLTSIIWSVQAAFLFWFGRKKKIQIFDYFSFAIICVTFFNLMSNLNSISYRFLPETINEMYTPVFNMAFLSSLIGIGGFFFIFYTSKKFVPTGEKIQGWLGIFNVLFPVFFLIILFLTFFSQINLYWDNIQIAASYELNNDGVWVKAYQNLNQDIFAFKTIWLINYAFLFTSALAFVNFKWLKNNSFNAFIFAMSGLMIIVFLTSGLNALSMLRDSYLNTNLTANYEINISYLLIRYVAYMFVSLLFYTVYKFVVPDLTNKTFNKIFEVVLSITMIWICSSELIHWLSLSGTSEVYSHGLSILWGILSFALIGYGIWKKKKHLRMTAIVLFGGTIIKLLFYDLYNLDTIQKTIVFVSVGAILLIVSFLYNKYRTVIFGND